MSRSEPHPQPDPRLTALKRFALAITLLNLLGHSVLGFEQSWAQPVVALLAAYGTELLLETIEARSRGRRAHFLGGARSLIQFLLPAHITGLAVSMLLYANELLMPVVFATVMALTSKWLLRLPTVHGSRHFMNPSNFGITVTLLAFPFVGIAPPYQFTEGLAGWQDWILPCVILVSGTVLNAKLTRRIPLIVAWLLAFVLQALLRSWWLDASLLAALNPMTGVAFLLFTYYMLTDPATTPARPPTQIAFGAAVALAYGALMALHVVFGLFFALTLVCGCRGLGLAVQSYFARTRAAPLPARQILTGTR
ncbi:hypothetical protein GGR77_000724 [Xanthomonas translucens]